MKKLFTTLFLIFAVAGVHDVQAQFQIGPRIGYDFSDAESLLLGADTRFEMSDLPVDINASLDYYLVDEDDYFGTTLGDLDVTVTLLNLAVNGIYEFELDDQTFTPFAGGGLALTYSSIGGDDLPDAFEDSDTDIGLSLVGGAYFDMDNYQPFVQANIKAGGDFDIFSLVGGVLFTL